MGSFFRFLFSRMFLINVCIAATLLAAGVWATLKYLETYTLHGQSIAVPDFTGLHMEQLDTFVKNKDFRYSVVDSIYDLNQKAGIVIDQVPKPDAAVKENRNIYLTVNASRPPQLAFPNLTDVTLRQAIAILETYGLKAGKLTHVPDQCVNCVLRAEQYGKEIEPGDMVEKGTAIDLVLGQGESEEKIPIPFFLNMTSEEAFDNLKIRGLNIGAAIFEQCETAEDSAVARVYKQQPAFEHEKKVQLGASIDLFFTIDNDKLKIFTDSLANATDSL